MLTRRNNHRQFLASSKKRRLSSELYVSFEIYKTLHNINSKIVTFNQPSIKYILIEFPSFTYKHKVLSVNFIK